MSTGVGIEERTNSRVLGSRASVSSTEATHPDQASQGRIAGQNSIAKKGQDSSPFNQASDQVLHACSKCSATFTRVAHLRRHEDSIHTSNTPKHHGCTECGKELSRRSGNDRLIAFVIANLTKGCLNSTLPDLSGCQSKRDLVQSKTQTKFTSMQIMQ